MPNRAFPVLATLCALIFAFLALVARGAGAQSPPTLPEPTRTPVAPVPVTLYIYEDANANGWRDGDELPYLPDSPNAAICFTFESFTCGHFKTYPFCLAAGYSNTIDLPAGCRLSVYRIHVQDTPDFTEHIGDFPLGAEPATLYFPTTGSFTDAFGTPGSAPTPRPIYLPQIAN